MNFENTWALHTDLFTLNLVSSLGFKRGISLNSTALSVTSASPYCVHLEIQKICSRCYKSDGALSASLRVRIQNPLEQTLKVRQLDMSVR